MNVNPSLLPILVAAVGLLPGPAAASEDAPQVRVLQASDLARVAEEGVDLPAEGEYTVLVYSGNRTPWAVAQADGVATLTPGDGAADGRPSWSTAGTVRVAGRKTVRLRVENANYDPPSIQGNYETETPRVKPAPAKPPLPLLVVLTTDPKFDPSPIHGLIRGRPDATRPPRDPRRETVRTNHEGANFRAPATLDAWRNRAAELRRHLLVTLGLAPMPPRTPLNPQVFGKVERDGYTIEKVALETMPGFVLTGNLYRPIGVEGRKPAILSPHGHYAIGRYEPDVQMRAIRWAKLGCVVFSYDMVGYADTKDFGHAFLNDRLRRWGLSLATLQTWNSLRAVDWIAGLPDVDSARIGCTGESGGGTQTFLLAAIDDRIAAAAPVVMVSDTFQGGCVCENCAGLRWGTDNVEIAALAAPRPMKLVAATGDWTRRTIDREAPAIRAVYDLFAKERFRAEIFDFPHNYNRTSRNAIYPFLARWLLGIRDAEGVEDPAAVAEGDQAIEKADDLRVFGPDHPAPAGLKSPEALEKDRIAGLARQLDDLAPARAGAAGWGAARDFLAATHRVRVGLVDPPAGDLAGEAVAGPSRRSDGVLVTHLFVGRKSTGVVIPAVQLVPPNATGRTTVVFSPQGQAWVAAAPGIAGGGTSGDLNPVARALLDRGQTLIVFDPFLIGESFDAARPADRRPDTVHSDCYNRPLAVERIADLAAIVAWAGTLGYVREVNVLGVGRFGPLALLARPALGGVARTVVDLGDADDETPPAAEDDVPGALQFGGLRASAALTAPAPLWIARPGPAFEAGWPGRAYLDRDAARELRRTRLAPEPADLARWIEMGD